MLEADWRGWLTSADGAIFGLFGGGKIIGMTGIAIDRNDPTKKQALLWGSWLEPGFRGKGLSDMMYRARIEWARAHPTCEKIVVSHRASNEASKRANQKHGFVFTHKTPKEWPDGGIEDDIFYELPLKKIYKTVIKGD